MVRFSAEICIKKFRLNHRVRIGKTTAIMDSMKTRIFEERSPAVSHEFLKTPTRANVFRLVSTFAL